jgi:pimeloyl-ACP methyl ester carboxylesterase
MTNVTDASIRTAGSVDASNSTAPTQFSKTKLETYAYRRFGAGSAPPLVFLQHFTGTLDNWDPAVTDALARDRDVILFESAGLGRSTGEVPVTIPGMTAHLLAFADALGASPRWTCSASPSAAWWRNRRPSSVPPS